MRSVLTGHSAEKAKKDLIAPNNSRRYYYNYNWQVLCEYDGGGIFKRSFIYGNYIDEALAMRKSGRRDSNPRRPAWEAGILPLNYARKNAY